MFLSEDIAGNPQCSNYEGYSIDYYFMRHYVQTCVNERYKYEVNIKSKADLMKYTRDEISRSI